MKDTKHTMLLVWIQSRTIGS